MELGKLAADISISFHVSNDFELDQAIDSALAAIGRFVGADRSSLFRYNYEAGTASNTQEWCAEGIASQRRLLQDLPMESFPWTVRMHEEHDIVLIPRVSDLPEEAATEKQVFEKQGIQSVLQVRVMGGEGRPIGLLSFDAVRNVRPWRDEDQYLLKVLSRILGAAFEQIRLNRALAMSEATRRTILETIPDLIFVLDRKGTITGFHTRNKGELFMDESEFLGTSCWEILRPECHETVRAALELAFMDGITDPFEDWLTLPSGDLFHFEGRFARLNDEQMLTIIRNITGRKKSQESIRWLSSQLALAEENQRKDLALRLHDSVSQDLAAVAIKLQQRIAAHGEDPPEDLLIIEELIQKTIRRTTDLTHSLSPPVLYELGLIPALSSMKTALAERYGFNINLESSHAKRKLDEVVSIHIYRIARELLINAIKHSGGENIDLRLETDSKSIVLIVHDDGKGIDTRIIEIDRDRIHRGFGLFSIRQRLESIGGSMELGNDRGARIRISIPLQAEAGEETDSNENRDRR